MRISRLRFLKECVGDFTEERLFASLATRGVPKQFLRQVILQLTSNQHPKSSLSTVSSHHFGPIMLLVQFV